MPIAIIPFTACDSTVFHCTLALAWSSDVLENLVIVVVQAILTGVLCISGDQVPIKDLTFCFNTA